MYTRRSFRIAGTHTCCATSRAVAIGRLVSHISVRIVWETAPSKERHGGEKEKERLTVAERGKKEGEGKRLECGGVAFNQSLASKCTVHVYVYCRRWREGRERRAVYGSVSFCSGGCLEIGAKLVRRTRRGSRCLGLRDARH